jgi:hypothetical protein
MNFWTKLLLIFLSLLFLIVILYKSILVDRFEFSFSKLKNLDKVEQIKSNVGIVPYSNEDIIPSVCMEGNDSVIVINTIDMFVKDYYITVDSMLNIGITLDEYSYNVYLTTITDFNNYTRSVCKKLGLSYKYDSIFNMYKSIIDSLYDYQNVMNDNVITFYVIIGVFKNEEYANKNNAELKNENSGMFYDNNLYFVYANSFYSLDEAKDYVEDLKTKDEKYSNSWIYKNNR